MKPILTTLFVVFSLFSAFAQTRTITGKVIAAEDSQGLPSVNVQIQGTSEGTTTDIEGNYSVILKEGQDVLEFSFIGYKTVVETVGTRTVIDVTLESDAKTLDEVVVMGYGVQKKSDVTGAVANVKGEELALQPVLTATQAVQGKVAGVQIISSGQPGSSPQIRIRGVSTAFGSTNTLYVVDGVLTDDISNINTADIVDMNILKDASAAAIYGSRGANGVVIIQTRRGTGKMRVNYSNNIGIRQAANLVKMANADEYRNYLLAANGSNPAASNADTDWYSEILRPAVEQSHNISLTGSTEKNNYLISVGYLNDNGIVLNNNFKRITFRVNEDFKLTDWLKYGFQTSFGNSINQNGFGNIQIDPNGIIGGVFTDAYRAAPILPGVVNGKYGNTSAYQNVGNPILDVNTNNVRVRENRVQGSTYLEAKPLSFLTLKSSFGADLRNSLNRGYFYKFLNDESTFITAGGNQSSARSSLNIFTSNSFRWVWDNTATFAKTFGKHDFTLLVGTTAEKYQQSTLSANRNDVPADPNLWYINVGDAGTSQNDGTGDAWSRNSYLGRLNYSYDGRYLLTATMRRDGTSRLPKQNRWQNYPSIGAAWVISREAFMNSQNLFDLLKLRASFGRVGNDQIPTNAFRKTVAINLPYPYSGNSTDPTTGDQINQIIDPNIVWEITEEYDLAMEFAILGSKLTGEVNYYHKQVNNLLVEVPILGTVGDIDARIITNIGKVQNKGLEVSLNYRNKIGTNFTYSIGGNVTLNQNRVLKLNGGQAIPGGGVGSQGFTTLTDNGHAIGSFYVLNQIGVFNSDAEVQQYVGPEGNPIQPLAKPGEFKYQDVNNDGAITLDDRIFAGSYQPKAYYGINLSLGYKRWDLSTSVYGNAGNQVYNGKKGFRQLATDNVEQDMVYNRWTSSNHTQKEPAANVGGLDASTYFVESGAFVRINNLTLGYTIPTTALQRFKLYSFRIFATSQNLFTYKKYSGFTAELPGDPLNAGIELSSYPTTRTIALGVNIGF